MLRDSVCTSVETFSFSTVLTHHSVVTINLILCLLTISICFEHFSHSGQGRIIKIQKPRILILYITKSILPPSLRNIIFHHGNNTNYRLDVSLHILMFQKRKKKEEGEAMKIMLFPPTEIFQLFTPGKG